MNKNMQHIATGTVVILLSLIVINQWRENRETQWEYRIFKTDSFRTELDLRYLGAIGWELLEIRTTAVLSEKLTEFELVLKRPVTLSSNNVYVRMAKEDPRFTPPPPTSDAPPAPADTHR